MSEVKQTTDERLQMPADLQQLPALLPAAAALSESVMRNLAELNPQVAQRIVEQDTWCVGHWRLAVAARAPASWELHWRAKGEEPLRVAGGPATGKATQLELDVLSGTQAFLQDALEGVSPPERAVLAALMARDEAFFRVVCEFGAGTCWKLVLSAVINGGRVFHVATLQEAPPVRLH